MAIVKMRLINIMGGIDELERVAAKYVSRYEIQVENCINELSDVRGLSTFNESFEYGEELNTLRSYRERVKVYAQPEMTAEEAVAAARSISGGMRKLEERKAELEKEIAEQTSVVSQLRHISGTDFDIERLLNFKYIKVRFGKLPADSYARLNHYINDELQAIFVPTEMGREFVYGLYFVPRSEASKVDAIFSSIHFEQQKIPGGYSGTADEAIEKIGGELEQTRRELADVEKKLSVYLQNHSGEIAGACDCLENLNFVSEIKKKAAFTKRGLFIITGWMSESDAKKLAAELESDNKVFFNFADENRASGSTPPVKLKNPKLIRPFEMFVKMYGMPDYNEMDPTPFVAITYSIIFGMMFGDVGQGALLIILGLLAYKFLKMDLGAILSCSGVFSVFFGFMYGSVFGFEDILEAKWMRPMENSMSIMITTVCIGIGLIVLVMIFNIINGIKKHSLVETLFGTNGAAGLIFYVTALLTVGGALLGIVNVPMAVAAILLMLGLVGIAAKEPMERVLKRQPALGQSKVMFFVETFFELFEVLLSYITNSISFIRVGAFALSHAGMMSVVMLLREQAGGGAGIAVLVLGNILVMGMEGLVVGIQVLRLEFYEMFSRFFSGKGREFKPIKKS
ncbi:MAG: V-type ATP synthase subunit I [Clostridia bacterium]